MFKICAFCFHGGPLFHSMCVCGKGGKSAIDGCKLFLIAWSLGKCESIRTEVIVNC